MGRKKKHPEHNPKLLMNELLDNLVAVWTAEHDPELKKIAGELEMSPAKVRKLLITAGERDKTTYFSSPISSSILALYRAGKTVSEIERETGLGYTSVQGYLPHKHVYNLDTISAENERIRLYRARRRAVEELHAHLDLPDWSVFLWRAVIVFEGYTFSTSGRGKKPGVKFKYSISAPGGEQRSEVRGNERGRLWE